MHSKTKGSIGEISVIKELYSIGVPAFVEFGDNSRVDIIALVGNDPVKIQVKSYNSTDAVVSVARRSSGPSYSYIYSSDEVDVFAVYVLDRDIVFWVNINLLNASHTNFRLEPTRNSQKRRVKYVDDYRDFWQSIKT